MFSSKLAKPVRIDGDQPRVNNEWRSAVPFTLRPPLWSPQLHSPFPESRWCPRWPYEVYGNKKREPLTTERGFPNKNALHDTHVGACKCPDASDYTDICDRGKQRPTSAPMWVLIQKVLKESPKRTVSSVAIKSPRVVCGVLLSLPEMTPNLVFVRLWFVRNRRLECADSTFRITSTCPSG